MRDITDCHDRGDVVIGISVAFSKFVYTSGVSFWESKGIILEKAVNGKSRDMGIFIDIPFGNLGFGLKTFGFSKPACK